MPAACRQQAITRAFSAAAAILALGGVVLTPGCTRPSEGRDSVRQDVEESAARVRQAAAASDPTRLAEVLDAETVRVPAGDFLMGSDRDRADERPRRRVYLDGFEIDRYEVSNAQYRRFVQATGRPPPPHWEDGTHPPGQEDHPVVGVSWTDADDYCRWAGKRLPTEAEWEKACRGTNGRAYPWGARWDARRLNVDLTRHVPDPADDELHPWQAAWGLLRTGVASDAEPRLRPVGSYPNGASPYGMLDAAGNASEWVADWYNWTGYEGLPARNPLVTGPPWNHVVRGSAWYDPAGAKGWAKEMSRCAARNSSHETRDPRTGFRCARSVP
jgi:formylglycine-generating enzyme